MYKQVAIIGAGPAGCALACFLRERDIDCLVFDSDKTPELMVGESLVPAAIPVLRRLGIEQQVAAVSRVKRGAALRHGNGNRVDFEFKAYGSDYPDYSYNIPRPQFDRIIRQRAEQLGVRFITHRANVELVDDDPQRELRLSNDSLLAAGLNLSTQPDILIDATGRSRLFSRRLNLSANRGPRTDIAHFAHFKNFSDDAHLDGQVVLSALACGWSWQIPLHGVTSVGVVMNADSAKLYGRNAAERLENAISHNPLLAEAGLGRQRVSEVMTYSNYQLITEQAHGKGWILLGDALGFVDPMLSPGVFMALESAELLDRLVLSKPQSEVERHSADYFSQMQHWHDAWTRLIQYFYDGRILSMGEMRDYIRHEASVFSISRYVEPIVSRMLSQLVSGVKTRSELNHTVLHHTCQHLIRDKSQMENNRIRSTLTATQLSQLQTMLKQAEVSIGKCTAAA
ncbi:NAD(P)/FAD-dependent oxidoreductase [Arenicella xantha]|uniref:Flavin-dependent dehydrogenase n=1 Tax=Arenicella xantha TaxID=644221 RepID=A0A395JVW6_9GAMM|nr:NAD(P)/FAD-dependent oxidoreductase [Arenicella xantha]RBP53708.1 flavin-dependent dehydrogenase [Arenicella xantha]